MSTKNTANRISQQTADQNLMDGITKYEATLTSFTVGSTSFKTADITAILQERIKTAGAVESTRATWQTAVKADRDERAKTRAIVSGVRQTIHLMFAGSIDRLADFGLKPRKTRPTPTPEQKAASVAKAKATRQLRHTMGTKQKAKIKATAPQAATATLPAAPAPIAASAPAPAAAPAPSAAAAPARPTP